MAVFFIAGYLLLGFIWFLTDPRRSPHGSFISLFKRDKTHTTTRMLLVLLPQLVWSWPHNPADVWIQRIAALAFILGFVLSVWAKLTMKANWGTPAQHVRAIQPGLVTRGPYAYSRNPIYAGLFIMTIAASIGVRSILFPLTFLFLIHIRNIVAKEEALLTEIFGDQYRQYARRVPRFF